MNSTICKWCSARTIAALAILTSVWLLLCLCGCGGNTSRVEVTGTVSLDGQPLELGLIHFHPDVARSAPSSGGGVINGQFTLPSDKGLLPGTYRVMIEAFKKTRQSGKGLTFDGSFDDAYCGNTPIAFNESGELEATIVAGEKNHFTFQLTTAR